MSAKHIALIYFYIISAAALALIVTGIFQSVNYVVNITQYQQYPVGYRETDCETSPYQYAKPMAVPEGVPAPTPTAQEIEKQKKNCEKQLARERKQQQLDDLKNAVTFSLVGTVLFAIHFPLALKRSKETKA